MKHKILYKLTHNLSLKLFSVLTACIIWLVVMNNNDPIDTQVYRNVSVTLVNEDTITNANKTYSVVEDTDKVNVYVTARRSVRSRLSSSSFTVRADLENYNEALGSVPLEVTCSNAGVSLEQMRIQPSSLKINMEDKVEESFGIVAKTSGQTAKGTELGKAEVLTGDTIRIAGPRSLINIIGKVTIPVDISGMTENQTGTYPIRIEDKNGAVLNEGQMRNLELKNMEGTVLKDNMATVYLDIWKIYGEISLEALLTGEPASGYNVTNVAITPKTVNLAASEAAIRELGQTLRIDDEIDIEGLTESKSYQIDLNETLQNYTDIRLEADVSSIVTVEVQIEEAGAATLQYPVSDITLNNAPTGKHLIFSPTDYLAISVQTENVEPTDIRLEDIKAEIDLSHCIGLGSYTVPVSVTLPEGYQLVNEVTIVVNIEGEEQEAEIEPTTEG